MKLVKSKNIHSIHYEPSTKTLEVVFNNKKDVAYHYSDVPNHVYLAFENAKSHGEHFAEHIKDKYKTKTHGRKKESK